MAEHIGQTIKDMRVALDGEAYRMCTFENAVLEYGGGIVPILIACTFKDCTWHFVGAAGRTLGLLQAINRQAGGDGLINAAFPLSFSSD